MHVASDVLGAVETHALKSFPAECCGILFAETGGSGGVVDALPAENGEIENAGRRFSLGHKAHIEAVEMEVSGGVRIVGYYHSHPGGVAKPSVSDKEFAVPGMLYLISSVNDKQVEHSVWRLESDTMVEVPFRITN